jgi:hypothetical protein
VIESCSTWCARSSFPPTGIDEEFGKLVRKKTKIKENNLNVNEQTQ